MVFLIYGLTNNKEEILIPDYAIRFRVIANSNTLEDQTIKYQVKTELEKDLNNLMQNASTSEEAKKLIQENLKEIRNTVNKYTKENKVSFGENMFPEKEYYGVTYPKGSYESLVVTLGNGKGNRINSYGWMERSIGRVKWKREMRQGIWVETAKIKGHLRGSRKPNTVVEAS